MENQDKKIPSHLQADFEFVSQEVHDASNELFVTNCIYNNILAQRLEQNATSDEDHWETAKENLNDAHARYNRAIKARIAIVRIINGEK